MNSIYSILFNVHFGTFYVYKRTPAHPALSRPRNLTAGFKPDEHFGSGYKPYSFTFKKMVGYLGESRENSTF